MNQRVSATRWAHEHIAAMDFLVVDVETSGYDRDAEVLQVVALDASGATVLSSYVHPLARIDEAGSACATNGITNERVTDAPRFKSVYRDLLDLSVGRTIIAFNAPFDRRMIDQDCRRAYLPALQSPWECAMAMHRAFVGLSKNSSLKKAVEDLGLPGRNWHDAEADCLATYDLMNYMARAHDGSALPEQVLPQQDRLELGIPYRGIPYPK